MNQNTFRRAQCRAQIANGLAPTKARCEMHCLHFNIKRDLSENCLDTFGWLFRLFHRCYNYTNLLAFLEPEHTNRSFSATFLPLFPSYLVQTVFCVAPTPQNHSNETPQSHRDHFSQSNFVFACSFMCIASK